MSDNQYQMGSTMNDFVDRVLTATTVEHAADLLGLSTRPLMHAHGLVSDGTWRHKRGEPAPKRSRRQPRPTRRQEFCLTLGLAIVSNGTIGRVRNWMAKPNDILFSNACPRDLLLKDDDDERFERFANTLVTDFVSGSRVR